MLNVEMLAEVPVKFERRTAAGQALGGVAEISTIHPEKYIVGAAANLGRFGCFVRTFTPVAVGTRVSVKITHDGAEFNSSGEVVYALPERGMGITFVAVAPVDEALLETWLLQTMDTDVFSIDLGGTLVDLSSLAKSDTEMFGKFFLGANVATAHPARGGIQPIWSGSGSAAWDDVRSAAPSLVPQIELHLYVNDVLGIPVPEWK